MTASPVGIRNNNPLNLRKTQDRWVGLRGSSKGFCVFSAPEYGIRAATIVLYNDWLNKKKSVWQLIAEWAPPSENPTMAYALFVALKMKIGIYDVIQSFDAKAMDLIKAMIKFENGTQPYSDAVIRRGIELGLKRKI